jgi:hypothetical protein
MNLGNIRELEQVLAVIFYFLSAGNEVVIVFVGSPYGAKGKYPDFFYKEVAPTGQRELSRTYLQTGSHYGAMKLPRTFLQAESTYWAKRKLP